LNRVNQAGRLPILRGFEFPCFFGLATVGWQACRAADFARFWFSRLFRLQNGMGKSAMLPIFGAFGFSAALVLKPFAK